MEQELIVMEIICNAGEARSLCYEALRLARTRSFEQAEEKLCQAKECLNRAHLIQTQLIEADQGEGKVPMTLVMVHAQDHLMTTILAQEMATEMVALHKHLAGEEAKCFEMH
ncbi:PTS lactose/cellobiose transporter subunit IIA [Vibrio cholerae]|uniref:PTS lactose/cellobiose transporter subunit IIA n=1 Tax=Vibrio cholerae TaxID=666 RepID=UPI0011D4C29F|nr:PTS lactose/cellobiose transporter subunit IIA [Vibrio cholerae]EGR0363209.1 PTS lactose/cellobiose transporter subunit IIA [Vibrio cholerae]EGR0936577.1 PTS lactose/cellobiose transporter subunit IIA [Vibrio cholerae]EIA0767505.1 PTS lactose/cellobiose transporter subunit IIA [Vibrio cholerae]EID0157760.1 PTS lactose/cellobiose transporter subunit IIA [Vibrio cholerae]EJL6347813.1 PTS lactose/cellobiose transporter subunit IIA [Vibrio cholerae]